jgi:hypothetical protein
MTKNVFYAGCTGEFWVDFAVEIESSMGLKPVLWSGIKSSNVLRIPNQDYVKSKFPDIPFYDVQDIYSIQGDFQKLEGIFLDQTMIDSMGSSVWEALAMITRQDPSGADLNLFDRFRVFHSHLAKWNKLIHDLKPDYIFHPEIPHFLSDYALLLVARMHKIPTIMCYFTKFRRGIVFTADIHDKKKLPLAYDNSKLPISETVKKYIDKIKSPKYEIQEREALFFKRSIEVGVFFWNYSMLKNLVKIILNGHAGRKSYSHYLLRDTHFGQAPTLTNFSEHMRTWKMGFKNLANREFYNKNSSKLDMSQKFVYFASSYQPERTTSPDAGAYVDLVYLLHLVRSLLPAEVKIYYKEHPRCFDPKSRGALFRDEFFYRELLSISNLQLVPLEFDSYTLIDKSFCTITSTGSVGLEAALRGKQSIIWGTPWYDGIDGAFKVTTRQEFTKVWNMISSGYVNDEDYNAKFLSRLLLLEGDYSHKFKEKEIIELKTKNKSAYLNQLLMLKNSLTEFLNKTY